MKLIKKIFLLLLSLCFFFFGIYTNKYITWNDVVHTIKIIFSKKNKEIATLYGYVNLNDKIIYDAIHNPALLRMQKIDQGGPSAYFNYAPHFSRYDHCVGVFHLVQKFGGSNKEQLTAMLHDISHSAFSHMADGIFQKENEFQSKHSYQDSIHIEFLKKSAINDLCEKYDIDIESLNPDSGSYHILENDIPNLCADRLEYNLRTAFIYKLLSKSDIAEILNHLHYETVSFYNQEGQIVTDKTWYFDDLLYAKKFAILPLHFMKTIWNSSWNLVVYKVFKELLLYAFNKKYITQETFLYGFDQDILDVLYKINDNYIIYMLHILHNIKEVYDVVSIPSSNDSYDEILKGKFRGINPLVKEVNSPYAYPLTELDYDFYWLYNLTKEECNRGFYIKYKKPYKASEII